jgi:hypothetical protein
VTVIDWLTSLPWPVFLAIWLPAVALMGTGLLRAGNWACDLAARHRRPRDPLTCLASALTCRACRVTPDGRCTCLADCFHVRCEAVRPAIALHQETK